MYICIILIRCLSKLGKLFIGTIVHSSEVFIDTCNWLTKVQQYLIELFLSQTKNPIKLFWININYVWSYSMVEYTPDQSVAKWLFRDNCTLTTRINYWISFPLILMFQIQWIKEVLLFQVDTSINEAVYHSVVLEVLIKCNW